MQKSLHISGLDVTVLDNLPYNKMIEGLEKCEFRFLIFGAHQLRGDWRINIWIFYFDSWKGRMSGSSWAGYPSSLYPMM
jgi:hypothetical protein